MWPDNPKGYNCWDRLSHVILSDGPMSSNGCILATITEDMKIIALCKVGCRSGWTKHGSKIFTSIAFYNGDLYGLVFALEDLVRFKIGMKEDSPTVTSTHQLNIQRRHGPAAHSSYLVELHGKLSMAILTR